MEHGFGAADRPTQRPLWHDVAVPADLASDMEAVAHHALGQQKKED
jgi:hypothetical protein